MVDHHDYRLAFAEERYGAVPINFETVDDSAAYIVSNTDNRSVDAVIDAIGFEAKGSPTETVLSTLKLEGSSGYALRQGIAAVRRGGCLSVLGVYAGFIHGFLFGDIFEKGITIKAGQTHVHPLLPELLKYVEEGRLQPEEIITHRLPLADAAEGYRLFAEKRDNCRKVVLHT